MAENPFLRKLKVDSIQGFITLSVKYWTDWISLFWSSKRFQKSASDESSENQSEVRFWSMDQSKDRLNLKTSLIVQNELFLASFFHCFDSSSCMSWSIDFGYNMYIMILNWSLYGSKWPVIQLNMDGPKVLPLIGKSWKPHPKIYSKYQNSGSWSRPISGKLIQYFFKISAFRSLSLANFWKTH